MSKYDSDVIRSLTTINGFFFVFMSVIASSTGSISSPLNPADVAIIFPLFICLVFACSMIGLELLKRLHEYGLPAGALALQSCKEAGIS
jgi:hypothetical protein